MPAVQRVLTRQFRDHLTDHISLAQSERRARLEKLVLLPGGGWPGLQAAIRQHCGKTWPHELLALCLRQFTSIWM